MRPPRRLSPRSQRRCSSKIKGLIEQKADSAGARHNWMQAAHSLVFPRRASRNAVARAQQFEFVSLAHATAQAGSRFGDGHKREGLTNAHVCGFGHHHHRSNRAWRLLVAPSGGRGHTASTASQIAIRQLPFYFQQWPAPVDLPAGAFSQITLRSSRLSKKNTASGGASWGRFLMARFLMGFGCV